MSDYKLDPPDYDYPELEPYQCFMCGNIKQLDSDLCISCESLLTQEEESAY